jgi:hypothetical protein
MLTLRFVVRGSSSLLKVSWLCVTKEIKRLWRLCMGYCSQCEKPEYDKFSMMVTRQFVLGKEIAPMIRENTRIRGQ